MDAGRNGSEAPAMSTILAALSNPTRMRILEILAANPDSIVASIVKQLPLAQATVSQHLKVLREAGLIYGEQRDVGGCSCCQINREELAHFAQVFIGWLFKVASTDTQAADDDSCSCKS